MPVPNTTAVVLRGDLGNDVRQVPLRAIETRRQRRIQYQALYTRQHMGDKTYRGSAWLWALSGLSADERTRLAHMDSRLSLEEIAHFRAGALPTTDLNYGRGFPHLSGEDRATPRACAPWYQYGIKGMPIGISGAINFNVMVAGLLIFLEGSAYLLWALPPLVRVPARSLRFLMEVVSPGKRIGFGYRVEGRR